MNVYRTNIIIDDQLALRREHKHKKNLTAAIFMDARKYLGRHPITGGDIGVEGAPYRQRTFACVRRDVRQPITRLLPTFSVTQLRKHIDFTTTLILVFS